MNYKKQIFSLFLIVALVMGIFGSTAVAENAEQVEFKSDKTGIRELNFQSAAAAVEQMELVCESDTYEFYFDVKSLFFALKSKADGGITLSNPYDAAKAKIFNGNIANNLMSQIVVNYTDMSNIPGTLWSYNDCVALEQFKVSRIENGVKVSLSIGKEAKTRILPSALSKDTYEKILSQIDDALAKAQMTYLYTEYGSDADNDMIKKYPYLKKGSLYILKSDLTDTEKDRLESYLVKAGITSGDIDKEYEKIGISPEVAAYPNFKMDIEYTLDGSSFTVNIPAESIEFDRSNYHLLSLKVLEYMGAESHKIGDGGFLLIPDGSGAVAEYSDVASSDSQRQIVSRLYGSDDAISQPEKPDTNKIFYLPVFGHSNKDQSLFAVVEEGSGLCNLSFGVSGGEGSYYTAYPIFTYVASEELALEAKVSSAYSTRNTTVYDTNYYKGNYKIRYALFHGGLTYSEMADYYREYLYVDKKRTYMSTTAALETVGTLLYDESFIGFSYRKSACLTGFESDKQILESLRKNGVKNAVLFLEAWRNGGLEYSVAKKFDPSGVLGGKKGLASLYELSNDDFKVYANTNLAYCVKDRMFDGFSANRDTVRLITKKLGVKMTLRPDTGLYDENLLMYAVTPSKYKNNTNSFLKSASKSGVNSFNVEGFGSSLTSDFKNGRRSNREESLTTIEKLLKDNSPKTDFSFSGANAYVLPYAKFVTDLPIEASGYAGESYSVPFVQLVLNGIVQYSVEALNTAENPKNILLGCLASGSIPKYTVAKENYDKIKRSSYTEYYSVEYDKWFSACVDAYKYLENATKAVNGAVVVKHTTLADGVTCSEYSNGVKIYVNRSTKEYLYENTAIKGQDYTVVTGK